MQGERLPRVEAVQEMVAAWKVLRKRKRKRPANRD
jgi:hypothetical protein